ncbi:MAG TPA: DUF58 domain-containing protein [Chloroflexota bacterium]|jgi:uncharacterized protein (DUF58 family)|nr:DUF58 domain-containing protein [Chloroflexota bacterium]
MRPETTPAPPRRWATERALRRLGWSVLRPLASRLGGPERSRVLAPGAELAGLREYQPGDDVRLIDWHVTARSDRPFVREAQAERALDAWLLVDVSRSVDWGTASCLKRERAEELAGLAWGLLARHGNRVGALLFADQPLGVTPPAAGEAGLRRMLADLRAAPRQVGRGRTDLGAALARAEALLRRPSLVVVVSDLFVAPGWQRPLARLARRHEVVAVRLADPRDDELPDVGVVAFEDPETGDQVLVDTGDPALRARFAAAARAEAERVRRDLSRAGVEQLVLSTAEELLPALARFLALRRAGGHPPAAG